MYYDVTWSVECVLCCGKHLKTIKIIEPWRWVCLMSITLWLYPGRFKMDLHYPSTSFKPAATSGRESMMLSTFHSPTPTKNFCWPSAPPTPVYNQEHDNRETYKSNQIKWKNYYTIVITNHPKSVSIKLKSYYIKPQVLGLIWQRLQGIPNPNINDTYITE